MSNLEDEPRLLFFRSRPHDLLDRPPLASSLQSLESSLFLVALQRYPHALAACVFATESALKSAFGQSPQARITLEELVDRARKRSEPLRAFSVDALDVMRRTRNRFIHYGFSPKDDRQSAELLLRTALPFLRVTYESLLGFSLDDALLPEFAKQIGLAVEVFHNSAHLPGSNPISFLAVLGHLVRWSVKDSLLASWELEAADAAEQHGGKFEVVEMRKGKAEAQLEPCWSFDCPICHGIETFVCQLDESELEQKRITVVRGVCVECELVAPLDAPGLANSLCTDQAREKSESILHDYGFV